MCCFDGILSAGVYLSINLPLCFVTSLNHEFKHFKSLIHIKSSYQTIAYIILVKAPPSSCLIFNTSNRAGPKSPAAASLVSKLKPNFSPSPTKQASN